MSNQLSINLDNNKTCYLCNNVLGNQTWTVKASGKFYTYCSRDCEHREHREKIYLYHVTCP